MVDTDDPVEDLGPAECWRLLESRRLGRLAFALGDELHVLPLNYRVDGGRLLLRTAEGSTLLTAAMERPVALQTDHHDDREAWSVLGRGRLRILGEDEARGVEAWLPEPWVMTYTYDVVAMDVDSLTGRRFLLRSPRS